MIVIQEETGRGDGASWEKKYEVWELWDNKALV
jgi:hypothetical protein